MWGLPVVVMFSIVGKLALLVDHLLLASLEPAPHCHTTVDPSGLCKQAVQLEQLNILDVLVKS